MFISARAAVEWRWRRRTAVTTVLLQILPRLPRRSRAVFAGSSTIRCNTDLTSTLIVAVSPLIFAPGSLIEVLLRSLAVGEPTSFRPRPIQRPNSSARLKYRPELVNRLNPAAQTQCSPRMRPISRANTASIVWFTQLRHHRDHNRDRDHNPAFRSVGVQ
jgi:hypothetical protein